MVELVLVVDDEPATRNVYVTHFLDAGFEVRSAATLSEAAEFLASTSFDAVITSASLTPELPGEGLALAAYVRCHLRQVPLPAIVLAAYGSPELGEAAARVGADFFLHKPVSLPWLAAELRTCIQARRSTLGGGGSEGLEHTLSSAHHGE
jgi:CheY-like chemotaxis protein